MQQIDVRATTQRHRRARRGGGMLATAVVALGLLASTAQAAAPAPADDTLTARPTGALDVLANDSDPDGPGDTLAVAVNGPPAHGTVTCSALGACFYRAAAGYTGTDAFTYSATDPAGQAATATVDVTVSAAAGGQAVVAADDDVATVAPHPVSFDVLANDHGTAPVRVQSSTSANHGTPRAPPVVPARTRRPPGSAAATDLSTS